MTVEKRRAQSSAVRKLYISRRPFPLVLSTGTRASGGLLDWLRSPSRVRSAVSSGEFAITEKDEPLYNPRLRTVAIEKPTRDRASGAFKKFCQVVLMKPLANHPCSQRRRARRVAVIARIRPGERSSWITTKIRQTKITQHIGRIGEPLETDAKMGEPTMQCTFVFLSALKKAKQFQVIPKASLDHIQPPLHERRISDLDWSIGTKAREIYGHQATASAVSGARRVSCRTSSMGRLRA